MNADSVTYKEVEQNFKTAVISTSFLANVVVFVTWLVYMVALRPL